MALIRGTTPTITFKFNEIEVADIEVAYLVIKQGGRSVIERDLETATVVPSTNGNEPVDDNYISWTLEQNETLSLSKNLEASTQCDWKLQNGLRGRSIIRLDAVEDTGKDEVI